MTNIKFTKDQFEALLKLVYIGNWVINAGRTTDTIKEFNELDKYLFSKTSLFGLEELSDEEEPCYPTGDFESGEVRDHIDNYNAQTFWEVLAEELTIKLLKAQYSEKDIKNMDQMQRVNLVLNMEDEIQMDFQKNGLNNLTYNPQKKKKSSGNLKSSS
ncbi:MAG TPA: hypothetical protein VGP47_09015 [Parachlamydiaceae bacterium]|nr:hypothetical protein [Parachlamydiaceae bacterium]